MDVNEDYNHGRQHQIHSNEYCGADGARRESPDDVGQQSQKRISKQLVTDEEKEDTAKHEQGRVQREAVPLGVGRREEGTDRMQGDVVQGRVHVVALVEEDRVVGETVSVRNDKIIAEERRIDPSVIAGFRGGRILEIRVGQVVREDLVDEETLLVNRVEEGYAQLKRNNCRQGNLVSAALMCVTLGQCHTLLTATSRCKGRRTAGRL